MAKNSGQPARGLLDHGGIGKGDATRTNLASRVWQEGYEAIDWHRSEGVERPKRFFKKYSGQSKYPEPVESEPAGWTDFW